MDLLHPIIYETLLSNSKKSIAIVKHFYRSGLSEWDRYPSFEMNLVIKLNNDIVQYMVEIFFDRISGFSINGSGITYVPYFIIEDMSSRGYDPMVKYHVHDKTSKNINFYCQSFELLKIDELNGCKIIE